MSIQEMTTRDLMESFLQFIAVNACQQPEMMDIVKELCERRAVTLRLPE